MSYAVVNKPRVDYLVSPDEESGLADEGIYGMIVEVLSEGENGYSHVCTHYGYNAYVKNNNILKLDENQSNEWKKASKFTIIKDVADVLLGANCKYRSKISLLRGSKIIFTGEVEGNFSKVQLADGSTGYVRSDFLIEDDYIDPFKDEDVFREKLLQTAKMYLGTQYKWGGKTPLGIDCSGLTSMAYMLNGVLIYRDAKLQGDNLYEIKREDLKKGDLIYFPGHIAMYMGEGRFIHSVDRYNGVRVNSINEGDELYSEDHAKSITMFGSIYRPKE